MLFVVDDETSNSMNPSIVSSNVLIGSVAHINARRLLIDVNSMNNVEGSFKSPSNETDLDCMNLADGSHRNNNANTSVICATFYDLYL